MNISDLRVSLVVAAAENNAIGKNNEMLWKLPADLKFFKHLTWAMPLIMGRKTYDSLGKALNGRINIVITRQENWSAPGVTVAHSLDDALQKAAETDCKEVFIGGGSEIYKMALPLADRIYLTRVHASFEADAFFPEFPQEKWELVSEEFHPKDEKHAFDFDFQTWAFKQ